MNRRIQKIAELIDTGTIPADIGTDHAQLPILLVSSGRCQKAYACDIAEGPLQAARENILACGLSEKIQTIISDGLEKVPDDADCAVLAGMGYYTAAGILTRASARLAAMKEILVEVNTDTPAFRQWISDHRWTIEKEAAVYDRGHDYFIIRFSTADHDPYSEEEILLGPVLIREHTQEFKDCARRRADSIDRLIKKRNRSDEKQERLCREHDLWAAQAK